MSQAPVWASRTGSAMHPAFQAYSQSVDADAPFVLHDLAGSIAHVAGLHAAGLLPDGEARALIGALQDLGAEWRSGRWRLDPALEDGHMNIESALGARIGSAAKRLHTGRSRNDQVAACLVLHARAGLLGLADALHALAAALAGHAEAHAATPWAARTHGQPAQPATLGFLLMAHAFRLQDGAQAALEAAGAVAESPLGSGAVAGSTLPLRPDVTAALLGLRPPRNALLATGTRDGVVLATSVAARTGAAVASLAEDLMGLYGQRALRLPSGFTTGSSLMPHKRNPDVLELVRGRARALAGPAQAALAVGGSLGLGYQRDLQAMKPLQTQALDEAASAARILLAALQEARFDAQVLAAGMEAPGLGATDAVEALVLAGLPFRDAYHALAAAHAAVEAGASLEEGLRAAGLEPRLVDVALAASRPDPSRRTTPGGPAPPRVLDQVAAFHRASEGLQATTATRQLEAAAAAALLERPVEGILAGRTA